MDLLNGERIFLNAIDSDDIVVLKKWFNDINFLRHYDIVVAKPHTIKAVEESLEYYSADNKVLFGIRLKENSRLIGICGFDDVVWNNGTATLFIGIGENDYQSSGYGYEALAEIIKYGFYELNLHRIGLNVISYNERARMLYEKLGFKEEGRLREFVYRNNNRYDLIYYGLLKSEWH